MINGSPLRACFLRGCLYMIKVLELDSLLRRLRFAYNRNLFWADTGGPGVRNLNLFKATNVDRHRNNSLSIFRYIWVSNNSRSQLQCHYLVNTSALCKSIYWQLISPTNTASLTRMTLFNLPFFWSFLLILSHCNHTNIDVTVGTLFDPPV